MDSDLLTIDNSEYFDQLFPLIDVRAPCEFEQGHIPGSVNIPILDDVERAQVGTCYKKQGREAAIELGNKIVSGENKKNKTDLWVQFVKSNPNSVVTCFRGGLRSRYAQQFMAEAGFKIPRLINGYKSSREYLQSQMAKQLNEKTLIAISGPTGVGKTQIVHKLTTAIDLEKSANHRGSAFGFVGNQPAQATFEMSVTLQLLKQNNSFVFTEDESRLIGRCVQPEVLFQKLRNSCLVLVLDSRARRAQNIANIYFADADSAQSKYNYFFESLKAINKKLGGLRYSEIFADLRQAQLLSSEGQSGLAFEANLVWIDKLLSYYYDPMYLDSLHRRNPQVAFVGNPDEALQFCQTYRGNNEQSHFAANKLRAFCDLNIAF